MQFCAVQFSLFPASLAVWLLGSSAGTAQIVPDNTLPNPSVVPSGCRTCEITGGTRSGSNLFHSFEQFSVPLGGLANFNQAIEVENIFARVTGRSRSTLNGTIQANGTANLFLLNPNGIIFGSQAALNVGGSFLATTGDRLIFADGTEFSAVNPQATPLLSISTPIGLQMGRGSGAILNRSQFRESSGAVVGLQVPANQTLALVGNGVLLTDGALSAAGGRITIGSVAAPSTLWLDRNGASDDLSFASDSTFRDIRLLRSSIDTSGRIGNQSSGGAIDLNGRNISMAASTISSSTDSGRGGDLRITADRTLTINSSSLGTFTLANGRAGDVVIQADRALRLIGVPPSRLGSQALEGATGRAGDVQIATERLSIRQGSRIEASTFGRGSGGNIEVQAAIVRLIGSNPEAVQDATGQIYPSGQITSGIVSQVAEGAGLDAGDSGRLTIETDRLVISDGGLVSTATFAGGDGGRLSVNAAAIVLRGASPAVTRNQYRSGIFVSAEPAATGRVGALSITTDRLLAQDRAEISANNRGLGQPGSATLNVGELNVQGGGEIRASSLGAGAGGTLSINANSIELIGTGTIDAVTVPSGLAALARRSGRAGNLQIITTNLNIGDGAEVSVSGTGAGAAGNLFVSAEQIAIDRGSISAVTEAGSGAEITLENLNALLLIDRSRVTAQANEDAAGGNVTISAPDGFIVGAGENNDVVANAIEGRGGNITITVQSILGLEERRSTPINTTNDIDASSEFGLPGSVTIVQPDVDPSRGLVELPTNLVDASSLIAQTCSADALSRPHQSELIVTGRGGLPPSPDGLGTTGVMLTDWATLPEAVSDRPVQRQSDRTTLPNLVEAQGLILNAQGEIVLAANSAPVASVTPTASCDRTSR